MNFWCLLSIWHHLLVALSCFEDNTKNIVLIQVFNLMYSKDYVHDRFSHMREHGDTDSDPFSHTREHGDTDSDPFSHTREHGGSDQQTKSKEPFHYELSNISQFNSHSRQSLYLEDLQWYKTEPSTSSENASLDYSDVEIRLIGKMHGASNIIPTEECSGLLVRQDFVITSQSCLICIQEVLSQWQLHQQDVIYTIRIRIILYNGNTGFVERIYMRNAVTLLHVKFEFIPANFHIIFPENSLPLGASNPSLCRVEGYYRTPVKLEYQVKELPKNSVYKHCPIITGQLNRTEYYFNGSDSIICRYNVTKREQEDSLCDFLPGSALFCPELQGLLYGSYARSVETGDGEKYIQDNFLLDDTKLVLSEIWTEHLLNKSLMANETNQSNRMRLTSWDDYSVTKELNVLKDKGLMKRQGKKVRKNRRSNSKTLKDMINTPSYFCGTNYEVNLFLDCRYSLNWIRIIIHKNTRFANRARRCGNTVLYWVISLATLMWFV